MKTTYAPMLACLLAVASAASATAQVTNVDERLRLLEARVAEMESASSTALNGAWKNGFIFQDDDKDFQLQLGGRTQIDVAFFDADEELEAAAGPFDDGVKMRRVRLYLKGTVYGNVEFMTEYDFAGSSFASTYIGLKKVPVIGNIRVGHLLEPVGLEEITSNNYITFMERGSLTAFNPVYNTGLMAFDTAANDRMTWAAGVFKETGNDGNSVSNEAWALSARLTGLPYYAEDGRTYIHLGASTSHRNIDDGTYRVRSRAGSALSPYVVNTGSMPADAVDLVAGEFIVNVENVSIQSEWMRSMVDRLPDETGVTVDDVDFETWYVQASCFLTGEHRPYSRKSGCLGRVDPKRNVTANDWSAGAWELAARYDMIDLNDGDIAGGRMDSYTVGLNWYLNPHTRIMLNYVSADVEDTGNVDTVAMRFQIFL